MRGLLSAPVCSDVSTARSVDRRMSVISCVATSTADAPPSSTATAGKGRGWAALSGRGAFPACREREGLGCLICEGSLSRLQGKGGVGLPYLGGEPFPPCVSSKRASSPQLAARCQSHIRSALRMRTVSAPSASSAVPASEVRGKALSSAREAESPSVLSEAEWGRIYCRDLL